MGSGAKRCAANQRHGGPETGRARAGGWRRGQRRFYCRRGRPHWRAAAGQQAEGYEPPPPPAPPPKLSLALLHPAPGSTTAAMSSSPHNIPAILTFFWAFIRHDARARTSVAGWPGLPPPDPGEQNDG